MDHVRCTGYFPRICHESTHRDVYTRAEAYGNVPKSLQVRIYHWYFVTYCCNIPRKPFINCFMEVCNEPLALGELFACVISAILSSQVESSMGRSDLWLHVILMDCFSPFRLKSLSDRHDFLADHMKCPTLRGKMDGKFGFPLRVRGFSTTEDQLPCLERTKLSLPPFPRWQQVPCMAWAFHEDQRNYQSNAIREVEMSMSACGNSYSAIVALSRMRLLWQVINSQCWLWYSLHSMQTWQGIDNA